LHGVGGGRMIARVGLDDLVGLASGRIERLEPAAAHAEMAEGAVLVDIRSEASRVREGVVPGALHMPRTVFEWRLDPASEWGSPHAPGVDQRVVVLCDHGFSSILAAATLVQLGFTRAADVVGGFEAWRDAGLPVAPARPTAPGELPRMGRPDGAGA
jgi:rhodanese-related sulfurtransferase